MGVQIAEILPKREIEIKELVGKKIAIDAYNWLYQFLSIIRQPDGTPLMDSKGRITSHLSGIFYRSSKLMEVGLKLVYVFDGEPPSFKYVTEERSEFRKESERKWKEALAKGEMEQAKMHAKASSRLTDEMIKQSKDLLSYMGIPVVQALSEGEAQCAHLCKKGLVFSTASQDSDSLLFGSPRLVRNLSITGRRKMPKRDEYYELKPEMIELNKTLESLGLKREQLIIMALLVGSDYNPGIKGIGPKKALGLIKKEKNLKNVLKAIEWNHEVSAEKIYDFYLNPPAKDAKLEFRPVQGEKILKLMVDEHEFSQERVEKVIKTLSESKQSTLGSYF